MRLRSVALLVVLVAVVPSGACGGDDASQPTPRTARKDRYVQQVSDALHPSATASGELQRQAGAASSAQQLVGPLGGAQKAYAASAERLDAIEAPAEVADLHRRLVGTQRDFAAATRAAQGAATARRDDTADIRRFEDAGGRYQQELSRLTQEYQSQGYNVAGP